MLMTLRRALLLSTLALVACGSDDGEPTVPPTTTPPDDDPPLATGPTFHADVAPILAKSCQGCHVDGGIAPFALMTYDDVAPIAGLVAAVTSEGQMPPWGAVSTDDCAPRHGWKEDIRLGADELATLEAWSKAGAPEGEIVEAPVPEAFGELEGAQIELVPDEPWVTSGESDEFRCFVLDPELPKGAILSGIHVVPGNAEVNHHVVVFTDPHRESSALAGPDGSFECFGGADVTDAEILHVWTPGNVPLELPSDVGIYLPPDALLVMQIHFHPAGQVAAPDLTSVQMRVAAQLPEWVLLPSRPIGNFETTFGDGEGLLPGPNDDGAPAFEIPANASDHVETMTLTMPGDDGPAPDIRLYGAQAHMHYVGVDLKVEIERAAPERGEPAEECLLHEPYWDFDWQRVYLYDAPLDELPTIGAGDRVTVTCRYDNTVRNPGVQRLMADQGLLAPVDVFLGEETVDEMCLTLLPVIVRLEDLQ